MAVYRVSDRQPDLAPGCWVAPGARVMGRVSAADGVGVWFNAVIRGDMADISIGAGSNIQDACVLHVDDGFPLRVGERVTVGHGATLHGCTIEDDVLIGMNATVLNGARVGRGSLIAAGALVREGQSIPPFSLVAGLPATVKRDLPEEETLRRHGDSASHYRREAARYGRELEELPPSPEPSDD